MWTAHTKSHGLVAVWAMWTTKYAGTQVIKQLST
jgi:hypothetical protein